MAAGLASDCRSDGGGGGVCFGGAVTIGGGGTGRGAATDVDSVTLGADGVAADAAVFGGDVGGGTAFGFDGGAELDVAGGVPGTIAVEPGREGDVVFGGDGDGGTFDRDGGAADPFAAVVVTGAGRCGWVGGGGPAHHVHA